MGLVLVVNSGKGCDLFYLVLRAGVTKWPKESERRAAVDRLRKCWEYEKATRVNCVIWEQAGKEEVQKEAEMPEEAL